MILQRADYKTYIHLSYHYSHKQHHVCIVWHIRPLHLLWIHHWDLNDIFILACVCTICLMNRVKANGSSKPNRKERGAYLNAMIANIFSKLQMQSIIWMFVMGLFILLLKVDNGIFRRHFVCNELMNLEEEDASVTAQKKPFFFHHVQCPDLIPV